MSYSADFTVLVVEMYLQKKPSHPLQTFKVLATSKMAKVFDMLYCNSLVIRKLASITEELGTPPKSLEELKRLKETISGLEIPNQFWRMVRFDDKFFAEPLNHQFTRYNCRH